MRIDDAIEIKKPEVDSQFRLKNCKCCESDNVAYVKYLDKSKVLWRAQCFDCGHIGNGSDCQHGAQMIWNGIALRLRPVACAGLCP